MTLSDYGSINKKFEKGEELSSPYFFKQIGIEVLKDSPIIVNINNKQFVINPNRILELENLTIDSLYFNTAVNATITYVLGNAG